MGFGVAVQNGGGDLEQKRDGDPDLPVREGTGGDGEAAGPIQVGGQTPAAEGEGEDGEGSQQGGGGNGGAAVADPLTANTRAGPNAELNNHPTS